MSEQTTLLEQLTLVAPFGVHFWDEITESLIDDGLRVEAYRPAQPTRRITAFVNRSGVYILRGVPGLRAFEHGTGEKDFWKNLPPGKPFVIEVTDSYRRFQPFSFLANLPTCDLFSWDCTEESPPFNSPPAARPRMVPLYSSPVRAVAGTMAVLRAQLWDDSAKAPAAWAMMEVHVADQPIKRGYADDQGRVAVFFPYPAPKNFANMDSPQSPFDTAVTPLSRQSWDVQITVAYQPTRPVPTIPDLRAVLQQRVANIWDDAAHTRALTGQPLHFGQGLILKSSSVGPSTPPAVLLVTPAA